ncbi:hypothetical protein PFISCL1PPCAC_13190, partial [Pristionchus fissidentatus]
RSCLVCSVPITSMHLGMDACRACSSFFKRARITGKEYPCRQGDRLCETDKDAKFVCRRCRFDKCIAVGLAYDGPMRERRKAKVPLLQRIKSEYKIFVERRRVQELIIVKSSGCHKRIPHPTEIYNVHDATALDIFNIFIVESFIFFKSAFPELRKLPGEQAEIIFKDFVSKLSMVENYFRTRQIWGGVHRFVMCSVVTCFDVEMKTGSDGIAQREIENAEFLESSARNYADDQNEILLPIFNRFDLSETEFYALIALVMSELDIDCDVSEHALAIIDRYRGQVLADLQQYYHNEMGLIDFSTRLGNLMSLNHAIQECKSLFKVFFRFFSTMFDVMIAGDRMKHFFL